MKKTRKILSIVLAIVFAFSSMPVTYISTAAADAVTYALDETGTLENPTKPVEATGSFAFDDLVKITIELFNTDYTFYQTKDNEHFALTQSFFLKKVNADDIKVKFESRGYWDKKTSDMSNPNSTTLEWRGNEDDGLWEVPGVKDNRTDLFLANHRVSETWTATTEASQALSNPPFELTSSARYAWNFDLVFKANIGEQAGEHNTNFYQQLKWRWDANDGSDFAKVDVRVQTRIRFLDAREFVKELARLQNIVANPDEYTQAYVSSAQAILNDIPDGLKTLSVVYDQSVIDAHTQAMKNLSLNAADYTKYNELYTALSIITNEKGAYTADSYATFKGEIQKINSTLSKSLDKTQQSVVDAATKALQDAFAKLVATDLSEDVDNTPDWSSRDKGYGKIDAQIDRTSFKFMQVNDYQKFQFDQSFYIRRYGGNNASYFHGLYFEETYPTCGSNCAGQLNLTNGTTEFLSRMDQSLLTNVTANDENGTSITAKEYNKWIWDGSVENAGDSFVSNGLLKHNHKIAKADVLSGGEYLAYAADSSPAFYGRPANDYGEINLTYIYRLGYMYDDAGFLGDKDEFYHWHIPTTIEVTDVRQLISKVNSAEEIIENADDYSDAYIASLKSAITGIPIEMTRGVEYYTQEEVDALFNQVNGVLTAGEEGAEAFADYTEYTELLEKLMAVENQSRYTEESYAIFEEEVYEINKNLSKTLPASEQAQVDAAVAALRAAYAKLEFYEIGDDNSYDSNDLPDYLGNSALDFKVSNTEYTFMQTYDGQKFAVDTELYLESRNDNYDTFVYGLQYSMVKAGDTTCEDRETPDAGCHNLENVVVPDGVGFTDVFLDVVAEGVEKAAKDANGKYIPSSDGTGTIGHNTTWVYDTQRSVGSSFINNGLITYGATISTAPHYATSTVLCNGFSGGASGEATGFEAIYSWRLGWGYREKHVLDNLVNLSSTTYRHVHIPVTVKLTDARALNSLYEQACNILKGKSDVSYTLETLLKLNEACKATPQDMVYGETYYTQDAVNAEYAKLKAAFDQLESGADYSDYFDAYLKAEEIINSDNKDSRGNKLYDEDVYKSFVETVTNIDNNLPKDLQNTEENKQIINTATQNILTAIDNLEDTKRADYSDLNDAMTEAEGILNAPEGTYTDKTLDAVQKAYDDAVNLDKNLTPDEQDQVDSVTDALEETIANKEYKADYSEFDKAYDEVKDIVDNPGKYTEETVDAAEKALEEADKLDKDLPDSAENREIINDATDALKDVVNNAVETADYTAFNEAYKKVQEIAENADGRYTEESVTAAQNALVEADKLEKNLPKTDENQAIVDTATNALQQVIDSAQKNADYTKFNEAKDALQEIVDNPDDYTSASVEAAQKALDEANKIPAGLPVGKDNIYQNMIDSATNTMNQVLGSIEKKADYTEFDKVVDELENIVNNPDKFTDESVQAAKDALDVAEGVSKDLPESAQDQLNEVTSQLQQVVDAAKEKADYSGLDEAIKEAEKIVNNPDDYTEESVKNAQDALDAAEALDKDLEKNDENQAVIDGVIQDLIDSATNAEKKADYTEFDKVVEDLENIVNNPDKFTDETVQAAKDALNDAEEVSKDLSESEQPTLDEITDSLKDVVDNAQNRADYTEYNKIKTEADNLVNDDGNGNPIYDEEAFQQYKDKVTEIDNGLNKNLDETQQSTVDEATQALKDLRTELDISSKEYDEIVIDPETKVDDTTVQDIVDEITKDLTENQGYAEDEIIVEFKDYTGKDLAGEAFVGTGSTMRVILKSTGELLEYKLFIVYGDVDGDGDIDGDDYQKSMNVGLKKETYAEEHSYFFTANDVIEDGVIDVLDCATIRRMM